MADTADILVVGGGLMGCATAYFLALAGARVTVAERCSAPGMETTARSGAIIRAHYGVPALVALALEANKRFLRFDDEVGLPCGFVQSGYTVLVDEADERTLRAATEMHQSLGAQVSLLVLPRPRHWFPLCALTILLWHRTNRKAAMQAPR